MPKKKELNIREKRFVAAKVRGLKHLDAMKEAGYTVGKKQTAMVRASQKMAEPHIQIAIRDALAISGATPEFAVKQLVKVAEQDEELGAKRLASKDILELHGWNKADRPTMNIEFSGNFFNEARSDTREVIDGEEV